MFGVDRTERIPQSVVQDTAKLHLRPWPGRKPEDEAVLVHLWTALVGIELCIGENGQGRTGDQGQLHLARPFTYSRQRKQGCDLELLRLVTFEDAKETRRAPVARAFVARCQGEQELFTSSSGSDVGQPPLFGEVQFCPG